MFISPGGLNPMSCLKEAGASEGCFLPERCGEPLTGLPALLKHVSV